MFLENKMEYTLKQSGLSINKDRNGYCVCKHNFKLFTGLKTKEIALEIMTNQFISEALLRK
jgi:hypothetical protein